MEAERHRLCVTAGPVLDRLYPAAAGTHADTVDQVADLLKTAPERLIDLARQYALQGCNQALSITKSVYPRVKIESLRDGYAVGSTLDSILEIINESQDVANLMADDVMDTW